MPSTTRRRLLVGGATVAVGTYGAHRLDRGARDAAFTSWTPTSGTSPLRRYDPANTAHNPNANPPRETPTPRELASAATAAKRPRFLPIIGPNQIVMHGTGVGVYTRGSGETVRERDTATPLAGVDPNGTLHTVVREPDDVDTPSVVIGYDTEDLRESYRMPLDADDPKGMVIGTREMYVGTVSGTLHTVTAGSGPRWNVDGSMPALVDGQLYATDAPLDGTVAYEQRTGLDRRLQAGPAQVWSAGTTDGFPHPPAVADGRLIVGSYGETGGAVVAFDADTGDRLWEPRRLGMDVTTPAIAGDRGYTAVGTDDLTAGLVAALDLTTGETVWRDEIEWHAFSPVISDDTLVVAGEVRADGTRTAGKVRAYDRTTGDVLWTHTSEPDNLGGLALVHDRVVATTGTSLYALA